ncbi:hypothetical protein LSH36_7g07042 [Paralvinella palmiformis]|uniref:Carboxylesterase type B domain-containing protein n=1 Tax=Paralvinella palmiformis TaxID=53620 RepID=A0AAD9KFC4_9ANNE|nr:hypothetical protein LSH36_7g07042 [Paralvinella palmiformis]
MCIYLATESAAAEKKPIVQTTKGRVAGRRIEHQIGSVTAFFGIPYARAPKGDLRFVGPKPAQPWTGVRDAGKPGPSCHQSMDKLKQLYPAEELSKLSFDEDCLNLNVFIPGVGDIGDKDPLAVMVWFAGRTLDTAAPNMEQPYALSSRGNIVVVTVNYRVGVLGYYTSGTDTVRGNLAFLDQQMALRWVQDNIEKFSGDKRRVTIAGEEAGARAVSLHVISPTSTGLFSKAISFGAAMTQKYVPRPENVTKLSAAFAKSIGCYRSEPTDIVKCIRNKSVKEITSVEVTFPVVVDGIFLTDDPYQLWNGSIASPVNYLIGCTNYVLAIDRAKKARTNAPKMTYPEVRPYIKWIMEAEGYPPNTTDDGKAVYWAVEDQYFPFFSNEAAIFNGFVKIRIDTDCAAPAARIASFMLAANRKTYLYEFERRSSRQAARGLIAMAPAWYAIGNVDMANASLVDPKDAQLSDDIITMISTFVRRGFPIWVDRKASPPQTKMWPVFDPRNDQSYAALNVDFDVHDFRTRPKSRAMSFWNILLPALVDQIKMAPEPSTVVIKSNEDMIFNKRTMMYILIFLVVLCIVLFFGMLGGFFLCYDARRQLKTKKKYKEEEENKYSETIDY